MKTENKLRDEQFKCTQTLKRRKLNNDITYVCMQNPFNLSQKINKKANKFVGYYVKKFDRKRKLIEYH